MTIEHRPGRLHGNADGLSRKPCDEAERNSMGESSLNNTKQENPSCMHVGPRYIWWQLWDKVNCQTGVALPMCFPGQVSGRDFTEGEVM